MVAFKIRLLGLRNQIVNDSKFNADRIRHQLITDLNSDDEIGHLLTIND